MYIVKLLCQLFHRRKDGARNARRSADLVVFVPPGRLSCAQLTSESPLLFQAGRSVVKLCLFCERSASPSFSCNIPTNGAYFLISPNADAHSNARSTCALWGQRRAAWSRSGVSSLYPLCCSPANLSVASSSIVNRGEKFVRCLVNKKVCACVLKVSACLHFGRSDHTHTHLPCCA